MRRGSSCHPGFGGAEDRDPVTPNGSAQAPSSRRAPRAEAGQPPSRHHPHRRILDTCLRRYDSRECGCDTLFLHAPSSRFVIPGKRSATRDRRAESLAKALRNIPTPAVPLRSRIFGLRPRPGRREERSERKSCGATALRLTPAEGANGSRLSGFACGRDDGLRKRRGLASPLRHLTLRRHPGRASREPGPIGFQSGSEVTSARTPRTECHPGFGKAEDQDPVTPNGSARTSALRRAPRAPRRSRAAALAPPSAPVDTGYLLVAGMTAESVAATCSSSTHRSRCSSSRASEARPGTGEPSASRRRSGTSPHSPPIPTEGAIRPRPAIVLFEEVTQRLALRLSSVSIARVAA